MNSRYCGKTVIKQLNLTNRLYNLSNNGSETENSGIKNSSLVCEHVSTQGTLARGHVSTQGTLVRIHVSMQSTLAREHVFSTQGTQFSRLAQPEVNKHYGKSVFGFHLPETIIKVTMVSGR